MGKEKKTVEERYKNLFNLGPQAVVTVNMEGVITSCNPMAVKLTGYTEKELVGKNVFKLRALLKKDIPRFRKIFFSLVKGKTPDPFECEYYHRNGARGWALVHVGIFEESSGKKSIQAAVTDITEFKRVEKSLKESEKKYRRMVEHSLQGIVIVQDFRIVYSNKAFADISGYSVKKLLSLTPEKVRKLVHPDDQSLVWGRMAARLEGKDVPARYEYRGIRKDGRMAWLEMVASRIEYQGKPSVQGAVIDISDRKKAEEKIKVSLNEKEVMLREIHHRVKNNMQIILSLLRIQSRAAKDRKTFDMFRQSQSRIKSMALIHESLYKSRDLAKIDFSDYISRMTTHLLSLYRQDLGEISLKQETEGIYVDINRAIPCGLIISELVSNSLKHAFPGKRKGQIMVKMEQGTKGFYTLTVKDTGIGFPKEKDFQEAETLGMQLVMDLVKQLKGSIQLKRKGGTEFVVKF